MYSLVAFCYLAQPRLKKIVRVYILNTIILIVNSSNKNVISNNNVYNRSLVYIIYIRNYI